LNIAQIPSSQNPRKSPKYILGRVFQLLKRGAELGIISKTAVSELLHTLGIRNDAWKGARMTNFDNYCGSVVSYGYPKVDRPACSKQKVICICRLLVN
jgi:hypothetical protein